MEKDEQVKQQEVDKIYNSANEVFLRQYTKKDGKVLRTRQDYGLEKIFEKLTAEEAFAVMSAVIPSCTGISYEFGLSLLAGSLGQRIDGKEEEFESFTDMIEYLKSQAENMMFSKVDESELSDEEKQMVERMTNAKESKNS